MSKHSADFEAIQRLTRELAQKEFERLLTDRIVALDARLTEREQENTALRCIIEAQEEIRTLNKQMQQLVGEP